MKLLIVDNFDSFTNNIINFIRGLIDGITVDVVKNDEYDFLRDPAFLSYDAIIISPGPGNIDVPTDLGISKAILETDDRPILGICLGHQAMIAQAGGKVELAPEPMHGRTTVIHTSQKGLFTDLPEHISVMRYHSWTVNKVLPDGFVCDAWSADGLVMSVRDTNKPRWGVQFHPESICTDFGRAMLLNFLREVDQITGRLEISQKLKSKTDASIRKFFWNEIGSETSPIGLVEAQNHLKRKPLLLESSLVQDTRSRFSIVEVPDENDQSVLYYVEEGAVHEYSGTDLVSKSNLSIFDFLERQQHPIEMQTEAPPFDFFGGFVGWFGYELKSETLSVASPPSRTPDAAFREVTRFFVVDHAEQKTFVCVSLTEEAEQSDADHVFQYMQEIWDKAVRLEVKTQKPTSQSSVEFTFRHEPNAYINLINSCHQEIRAGESYELCLTNMISTNTAFDTWEFYKLLRQRNPSVFGGFLSIGDTEVASSSPERFLKLHQNNVLESKPIKGTAPRGLNADLDRILRQDLQSSEKERAENIMIVDLVRHDLSSVAVPGSIEVPKLCAIESYPAVHQMVSTIQARLRPDLSLVDALKASFPGGSMTGAPKVRSVQLLDEFENGPRGVYSGALGWIGYDGQMDLSIVIRTLVKHAGISSIGCGGAITYLSDPQSELDEIMTKSRALVRTLAELVTGDPENYTFTKISQAEATEREHDYLPAE